MVIKKKKKKLSFNSITKINGYFNIYKKKDNNLFQLI
jgi:hypothetical protein